MGATRSLLTLTHSRDLAIAHVLLFRGLRARPTPRVVVPGRRPPRPRTDHAVATGRSRTALARTSPPVRLAALAWIPSKGHRSSQEETRMIVSIVPHDGGGPQGKLADAELHFTEGPLEG